MAENNRKYAIKFSGVGVNTDITHETDGKMDVEYCYTFGDANIDQTALSKLQQYSKIPYEDVFPNFNSSEQLKNATPMMMNYVDSSNLQLQASDGAVTILNNAEEGSYSIYRREYEVYQEPGNRFNGYYNSTNKKFYWDSAFRKEIEPKAGYIYVDQISDYHHTYKYINEAYVLTPTIKIFKGPWEPVSINTSAYTFRDFNIKNGRSYQYAVYPENSTAWGSAPNIQAFANCDGMVFLEDPLNPGQGRFIKGDASNAASTGQPVVISWNCWSLVELKPVIQTGTKAPVTKQVYEVNNDQIWFFKYGVEHGAQAQNISRSEIQVLGEYPKFGFGPSNYASGDVTAQLGSEIILGSKFPYTERLAKSRIEPLSTNEKAQMLLQWKKLVMSKNPKLLRDIKGQSWIVQIVSSSSTTKSFYNEKPDTITFQWKQIASTDNVIINGACTETDEKISQTLGDTQWTPSYKEQKY